MIIVALLYMIIEFHHCNVKKKSSSFLSTYDHWKWITGSQIDLSFNHVSAIFFYIPSKKFLSRCQENGLGNFIPLKCDSAY